MDFETNDVIARKSITDGLLPNIRWKFQKGVSQEHNKNPKEEIKAWLVQMDAFSRVMKVRG
jgi:hypothetical protein